MLTLQLCVILGCLLLGTRYGGMGLGLISGIGLFILCFVFGVAPGKPPIDVMLTILAVIGCAATLQTAGGLDVLMRVAERVLRKHPEHITLLAPITTWSLTVMCGTGPRGVHHVPHHLRHRHQQGHPSRTAHGRGLGVGPDRRVRLAGCRSRRCPWCPCWPRPTASARPSASSTCCPSPSRPPSPACCAPACGACAGARIWTRIRNSRPRSAIPSRRPTSTAAGPRCSIRCFPGNPTGRSGSSSPPSPPWSCSAPFPICGRRSACRASSSPCP